MARPNGRIAPAHLAGRGRGGPRCPCVRAAHNGTPRRPAHSGIWSTTSVARPRSRSPAIDEIDRGGHEGPEQTQDESQGGVAEAPRRDAPVELDGRGERLGHVGER